MKHDSISIIEAAYDLEGDDQSWLERLLQAARVSLDRGLGVIGYFFDANASNRLNTYGYTSIGATPSQVELARVANSMPFLQSNETMNVTYRSPKALRYASAALGRGRWKELRATGVAFAVTETFADILILNSTDPSRAGCILAAPDPSPSKSVVVHSTRWCQISAHIAAGLRLRRRLCQESEPSSAPDAVLSPTGQLMHAEGAAKHRDVRALLRQAALRTERARGPLRGSDPDEAIQIWRGLVDGRWSLIDQFETDGRRFLVAHRNELRSRSPRKLSPRERDVIAFAAIAHSNKLIAYELGLSLSAVSGYLSSALAKLGLGSRAQLIELASQLGAASSRRTVA